MACKKGDAIGSAHIDALETLLLTSLQALQNTLETHDAALTGPDASIASGYPAMTAPQAQAVLEQLAIMLAQTDMSALEWFAQHRDLLQSHYTAAFEPLETALQALDFEVAEATCIAALQSK